MRSADGESVVVAVNASHQPARLELPLPMSAAKAIDLLNPGDSFPVHDGKLVIDPVPPCWARLLRLKRPETS